MESIKELRVKLQTNQLGHPILQRVLSIYLTRIVIPTNITANQVSAAMLVVGLLASLSIFLGYIWLGFFLIYLSILLDAVDGEVARYRKTFSLQGIYLDLVNHLATQGLFFLALAFWVAEGELGVMRSVVLILGTIGAFAMSLRRANGDLHREIFVHHYSEHPEQFSLPQVPAKVVGSSTANPASFIRALFGLVKKAIYQSEYLAIMVIVFFLTFLSELVFFPMASSHSLLKWLIIVYAAVSCLYLLREVIGGYYSIEGRVALVKEKLASK